MGALVEIPLGILVVGGISSPQSYRNSIADQDKIRGKRYSLTPGVILGLDLPSPLRHSHGDEP